MGDFTSSWEHPSFALRPRLPTSRTVTSSAGPLCQRSPHSLMRLWLGAVGIVVYAAPDPRIQTYLHLSLSLPAMFPYRTSSTHYQPLRIVYLLDSPLAGTWPFWAAIANTTPSIQNGTRTVLDDPVEFSSSRRERVAHSRFSNFPCSSPHTRPSLFCVGQDRVRMTTTITFYAVYLMSVTGRLLGTSTVFGVSSTKRGTIPGQSRYKTR